MIRWSRVALSSSLVVTACFDPDPNPLETESGSSGVGPTTSDASTSSSGSGQVSVDDSSGGTTTTPIDPTTGDPTTGDPTTSTGPDDTTSTTGDETTTTGEPACSGVGPAGLPGVNPQTIWIANSTEGTISKIDTVSMVELGRFATRPDPDGSPSRTSVSLDGDVAVANRNGGLTKFYGDPADCVDANGDGEITTSAGGANVLPWDQEECRAWYLPLVYTSQRPVAWTTGTLDEGECEQVDERVWTAGVINNDLVEVLRVDGETGVIEASITIPEIVPNFYGLYGAAVDAEGNMWASQLGQGQLVRVDAATLDYELWPMPLGGYGMTVGPSGYVYTCSYGVARFDPVTETWATADAAGGSGGCVEDGAGTLWLASSPVVRLDAATLTVQGTVALPEYVHGVSIDFAGQVWGVALGASAYRIDPATGAFDTFNGLVNSYTYSDMTGYVLASVAQ